MQSMLQIMSIVVLLAAALSLYRGFTMAKRFQSKRPKAIRLGIMLIGVAILLQVAASVM